MTEHPPEQERARKIAEQLLRDNESHGEYAAPHLMLLARAYLALLAAHEDRSAAFERAAADCVRLEGENERMRGALENLVAALETNSEEGAPDYAHEALAPTPKPVVEEENDDTQRA